ncbi:MAG: type IV toxin-antitoxin system AbiEi family antitoxin [Sterolibacterium sp.]
MDKKPVTAAADWLDAALTKLRGHGVNAHVVEREAKLGRTRADALVEIEYGGQKTTYAAELRRGLRPNNLGAVLHQLERLGEQALLVADFVNPVIADQLRVQRVAFVDLAGNAYLEQPPLLVWVKGQRLAEALPRAARGGLAFQGGGLQVLFVLLCHPEWADAPYRKLAQYAGVAHGTVGGVMAELVKLGYVATVAGKRRLLQRERLLQQWAEAYPRALRPRLLLGRYRADTLEWWNSLDPTNYGMVLGGEPAAGRMTQYLRPGAATFYAEAIEPRLLIDLRLRNDPDGNVDVLRRFWTFDNEDVALAPAPLVYADLLATGDARCIETAHMIYDRYLEPGR